MPPVRLLSLMSDDIDVKGPGRKVTTIDVSYSNDRHAYGAIRVPVVVVAGEPGPTVLLLAGTHGDEYEGQIVLQRLVRTIKPEHVTGRLIVLPALNLPAVRAATRVSPIDGRNLNRTYPGEARGDVTQQIAHAVSERLLPVADYALDLHSGGSASFYLPSAYVYEGPSRELFERKKAAAEALALPWSIRVVPRQGSTTFSGIADDAGVCAIATELGGGGMLTPDLIGVLCSGVSRLLASWGALKTQFGASATGATRWVTLHADSTVYTPSRGLFEPERSLGQCIEAGERVGWIYPFEEVDEPARPVTAPRTGIMTILRRPPMVDLGDALFTITTET